MSHVAGASGHHLAFRLVLAFVVALVAQNDRVLTTVSAQQLVATQLAGPYPSIAGEGLTFLGAQCVLSGDGKIFTTWVKPTGSGATPALPLAAIRVSGLA